MLNNVEFSDQTFEDSLCLVCSRDLVPGPLFPFLNHIGSSLIASTAKADFHIPQLHQLQQLSRYLLLLL